MSNLSEVRTKVEGMLTELSVPGRTLWDKKEIDHIRDGLLDIWAIVNVLESVPESTV